MMVFIVPVVVVLALAVYVDIRNRKMKNKNQTMINPNAKPGEDSNYMMGDNRYLNGGG